MVPALDALRFVVGVLFLTFAAALDVRTRRVSNRVWLALGSIGLAVFAADLTLRSEPAPMYFALVPAAAAFLPHVIGRESARRRDLAATLGAYGLGVLGAILGLALVPEGDARARFLAYLSPAAMVVVFRIFYEVRLLRGGADAKALMATALLVPAYPDLPGLPVLSLDPRLVGLLQTWFPFSFLVLLNGALAFALAPVAFLAYNATRGAARLPEALFGVKAPLDRLPKFAWLMDRIEDGRHVVVLMPRGEEDRDADVAALRKAGFTEAWVTPQLPFITGIAVGFLLAFVVGNPLLALIQAVL